MSGRSGRISVVAAACVLCLVAASLGDVRAQKTKPTAETQDPPRDE